MKKIELGLNNLFLSTVINQQSTMVKAWASGLVDEYETVFAHKIDWDAAKQRATNPNPTSWTTEEKDGWTYRLGVRYLPADKYGSEIYDVQFKKQKLLDLKNVKIFTMSAYKDESRKCNKNTELKRGDWVYVFR